MVKRLTAQQKVWTYASVSQVCRAWQLQHMPVRIYSADSEYSSKVELTFVKTTKKLSTLPCHFLCTLLQSKKCGTEASWRNLGLILEQTNDSVNDLVGLKAKAVCWHKTTIHWTLLYSLVWGHKFTLKYAPTWSMSGGFVISFAVFVLWNCSWRFTCMKE